MSTWSITSNGDDSVTVECEGWSARIDARGDWAMANRLAHILTSYLSARADFERVMRRLKDIGWAVRRVADAFDENFGAFADAVDDLRVLADEVER